MGYGAYANSALLEKIQQRTKAKQSVKLAFLDIDSTMTGSERASNATRRRLEDLGYIITYVTARTEEMVMSSSAYQASVKHGFERPVPLLIKKDTTFSYQAPETVMPVGLLDPDIIAGSTGSSLLIRQVNGSYLPDGDYEATFGDSVLWKKEIMGLIKQFNHHTKKAFFLAIDNPNNYDLGKADVSPQKYRLSITFKSQTDKRAFRSFIRTIREAKLTSLNLHITDDSKEKKDNFLLILTPKTASKRYAVDQIINQVTSSTGLTRPQLEVLIAGDSFPDIDMGMRGAKGTHATFILAGGSQLSHALTCRQRHEEMMDDHLQELKDYLHPRERKGHYGHKLFTEHRIIILDEIQQAGVLAEVSVASILALLNDAITY